MNEPKFKVGDRVRAVKKCSDNKYIIGKIATIKEIEPPYDNQPYGVEFDKYVRGHKFLNCGGRDGHCWWCPEDVLEPVNENKIVITTDGKTTTAKLYDNKKLVKSAEAKCSPEDEFNFNIGAAIALERLVGNSEATLPEETWYNGKVVCVDNQHNKTLYTSGKIYEFKNGYMINNDNLNKRFRNFKEFTNFTVSKFIEVVE